MRTEAWTAGRASATLYAYAAWYAIWRAIAVGGVDWVGVIILALGGTLCAVIALHVAAITGRTDRRLEAAPDVQSVDGAGEVWFSDWADIGQSVLPPWRPRSDLRINPYG